MFSHNFIWVLLIVAANTNPVIAQNGRILKDVPVLSYHNIASSMQGRSAEYTCSKTTFEKHLKTLYDSSYHSISTGQLYNYLEGREQLPEKPFLLTFDDGHQEHFTIVAPLLQQYNFTAAFFIPTCYINKKNYLTEQQIRILSEKGFTIGAHSFDHPNFRHLDKDGWNKQLIEPIKRLEQITNKKIEYFAYPFGTWNDSAILHLRNSSIKAAFQLGGKKSTDLPLYTIRRILVAGDWSTERLIRQMKTIYRASKSLQMVIDIK